MSLTSTLCHRNLKGHLHTDFFNYDHEFKLLIMCESVCVCVYHAVKCQCFISGRAAVRACVSPNTMKYTHMVYC